MKTELIKFQKDLVKEHGLFVIILQSGQVRRYGESIYLYEVVDIYQQYTKDEVLELCAKHVQRAELPVSPVLKLSQTVLDFKQLSAHLYLYKCGHDYTD